MALVQRAHGRHEPDGSALRPGGVTVRPAGRRWSRSSGWRRSPRGPPLGGGRGGCARGAAHRLAGARGAARAAQSLTETAPPRLSAARTARRMLAATASAAATPTWNTLPGRRPVAMVKTQSPSRGVCTGSIARAKPSCAIRATMPHCSLSRAASVMTTARVVFSIPPNTGRRRHGQQRRLAAHELAVAARPGQDAALLVQHVAQGVDDGQCGDCGAAARGHRGDTHAALHHALEVESPRGC